MEERIRLESISTFIGAVGVMLIAYVTYLIFPTDIPQSRYMRLWLAPQLVINSFWLAFIIYHANYNSYRTTQFWPYLSTIVCSFNGFVWGAGWVFFVGDVGIAQAQAAVIFTIILGGVFTGGVLATLFHLPSLISFMFCTLLPALIGTFVNEGIFHVWFGITLIVYMLACTAFALNLHGFLMDTLEQREEKALLAQQLAEEKQRAERASLEKTRFLAAASHDLRQPLQALQFFQHSLEKVRASNSQEQHIIEGMGASISALNGLLNAMLDVAQLDAGKQTVHKQVFPLNDLFRHIYQQCKPQAEEAGLVLRYVSTCAYIHSDPTLLGRITQNLVHNAIKHMGGRGGILIGGRRQGKYLRIEIRDNGVGIPFQEQESIFREFYQLHNPERKRSRGLGLGLAIVKRLSASLEHEIKLWSQPGKGCTFSITVPLANPPTLQCADTELLLSLSNPRQDKVLVVEDDEHVLESLQTLLTLWGYNVIISQTPEPEALIAEHPDMDFIISDYQLNAEQDGVEVIQQLRELAGRDIPALLITGNTSPILVEKLEKLSILVSYKPINPTVLKKMIADYN
ncbi:MAG: hybrid sensor histidine kinase/response regulator [Thiothrix sp.]|uniref:ATP-binding response regulator n=1 Tax=Thiothrix sp. TaxID=1032 RepID=UPI00260D0BCE|nr:hybrid sensor histidine kinase/response regulator [Thiothrix sp.]MDD5393290.1 hybrid sensor histidine kinase/response regulator [Thiothrix sp.]